MALASLAAHLFEIALDQSVQLAHKYLDSGLIGRSRSGHHGLLFAGVADFVAAMSFCLAEAGNSFDL